MIDRASPHPGRSRRAEPWRDGRKMKGQRLTSPVVASILVVRHGRQKPARNPPDRILKGMHRPPNKAHAHPSNPGGENERITEGRSGQSSSFSKCKGCTCLRHVVCAGEVVHLYVRRSQGSSPFRLYCAALRSRTVRIASSLPRTLTSVRKAAVSPTQHEPAKLGSP